MKLAIHEDTASAIDRDAAEDLPDDFKLFKQLRRSPGQLDLGCSTALVYVEHLNGHVRTPDLDGAADLEAITLR